MGVTVFPAPSAPVATYYQTIFNNGIKKVVTSMPAGYYMITSYAPSGGASTSVNVSFATSDGDILVSTFDYDSGSTTNQFTTFVNLPNGATEITKSAANVIIILQRVGDSLTHLTPSVTAYRGSGSVTLSSASYVLAIGGGGAGGPAGYNGVGGGGGGSGYFASGTLAAGTYSYSCGAGGSALSSGTLTGTGGTGGTTTISTLTAAGGLGGYAGNETSGGGAGGSGGGQGGDSSPTYGGGAGGSGGSNGVTSYPNNGSGGAGQGTSAWPFFITAVAGGAGGPSNGSTGAGGGGGSAYGAGGAGGNGNGSSGTDGGGGSGTTYNNGSGVAGPGGAGVILVVSWS